MNWNEEEHERVSDKGSIVPKRLDRFRSPVGDRAERLEIAQVKARGDRSQDAGQTEVISQQERAIGGDRREGLCKLANPEGSSSPHKFRNRLACSSNSLSGFLAGHIPPGRLG